jgi:hypothetical protein
VLIISVVEQKLDVIRITVSAQPTIWGNIDSNHLLELRRKEAIPNLE